MSSFYSFFILFFKISKMSCMGFYCSPEDKNGEKKNSNLIEIVSWILNIFIVQNIRIEVFDCFLLVKNSNGLYLLFFRLYIFFFYYYNHIV